MGQILTCRYSINVYNTYTNKTKCKPYYNTKRKITAFWHPTFNNFEDSDNVPQKTGVQAFQNQHLNSGISFMETNLCPYVHVFRTMLHNIAFRPYFKYMQRALLYEIFTGYPGSGGAGGVHRCGKEAER